MQSTWATYFLVPTDNFLVGSLSLADHSVRPPSSYILNLSSDPSFFPPSLLPSLLDASRPNPLSHFFPFASSSLPSGRISNPTSQTSERVDDDEQYLSTTPTIPHTTSRKSPPIPRAPPMIIKSSSSPISDFSSRSRTPRHSLSKRVPALPYRSSSPIPLPRSRSRSSTNSSSSSGSDPQSSQQYGMGRKVAASLDIFRETISSADELDDVEKPSLPLVTRRRVPSKRHPKSSAEPEYSFFKRSEWPDRGSAATRRERSSGTRDRARTRDGGYSTSVSRSTADDERRKDRPHSVRENVISDLVNWRTGIPGDPFQDRGRTRKRSLDSNQPIGTIDHQPLHRNESPSFRHPRDLQYSPSSSSPVSLTDIALTSPIVPSAIIADSPLQRQDVLPPAKVPSSPYATEDEDDESSNWEDETASDSGTTVSSMERKSRYCSGT